MRNSWTIVITIVVILSLCLISCACVIAGAGLFSFIQNNNMVVSFATSTPSGESLPTLIPSLIPIQSSPTPGEQIPTPTATMTQTQVLTATAPGAETLLTLTNAIVPINDMLELAERFEGKTNLPRNLDFPVKQYQIGDQSTFMAGNADTDETFQVAATLRYITDHVYFWVEDRVSFDKKDLKDLVETFETEIYPKNREFFGSEWTPGVDADPHLFILYAKGLGTHIGGYYSPVDEYLTLVRADSNAHEMFFINADNERLDRSYTYGILAHEFQHMIHWKNDRNEESWVNEGFADLAILLNGYPVGGADFVFAEDTDLQLTDWPADAAERGSHYGAAFLFMTYFLDRFGEKATQAVVADPLNGIPSIDHVLSTLGVSDTSTGKVIRANDVFTDWALALFLQDPDVGDGRYTFHNYSRAPEASTTEEILSCPTSTKTRDVSQYGIDYIRINCRGNYTLHFEGTPLVNVIPADPHSGKYFIYSNKGDDSDMTLTRSFDFSSVSGPLSLTYWTWYDLEENYDYVYLTASTDGVQWEILTTPSGVIDDPTGNSYGWGYTGFSGGRPKWIQEMVDISQYAGKKVQFRFEYITDAGVNGEGFLLDDIAIPEIRYSTDFENDSGGWEGSGFVRIQNILPQFFRVSLILSGKETTVKTFDLPVGNAIDIPIQIEGSVNSVVLVVSGVTPFSRQKAAYQFSINP